MFEFGCIVCVAFPFTDLSATKLCPALVVSRHNEKREDIVLAFITSRQTTWRTSDVLRIDPSTQTGLRVVSYVRFDKLVTLSKELVTGTLGHASDDWLAAARPVCHGVFGFGFSQ